MVFGNNSLWKKNLLAGVFCAIITIAYLGWTGFVFGAAVEFPNPVRAQNFPELIETLAKAIRMVALPLAVVAIIFVGFKFVTAAASGNANELTKVRQQFWWILLGTAIIVGASVLAQAVVNFAKDL